MGINADALAGKLREILLKKVAAGGFALPPLPATVARIRNTLASGHDADAIQASLEQDPVLALEIVRRAVAAGRARRIQPRTLRQSIDGLGPQRMRRVLAETIELSPYKSRSPDIRERSEQLWHGSVTVGDIARRIAVLAGLADPDEALLAGLMHGVGRPVAGIMLLELERAIARHNQATWIDVGTWLAIVEQVQAPVGAAIAESWQMSPEIRDAVSGDLEFDPGNRHSLSNAVRMAYAIAISAGVFPGVDPSEAKTMLMIGRSILGVANTAVDDIRRDLERAA